MCSSNQADSIRTMYNISRKGKGEMNEWHGNIQKIIDITDIGIKNKNDEELTLKRLADELGYSEFYVSRKFREISGMQFRGYLRYRRLAFALTDLRDTDRGILDIALDHGFSSHEAFTRAFRGHTA